MLDDEALLALEERAWRASGDRAWYEDYLADDVVMLFPSPAELMERDEILDAVEGARPWATVEIEDRHVLRLDTGAVALAYRATAAREGDEAPYMTAATSIYVERDGRWRLALHQQTPLEQS
jgi:uncharacterized protein (TIGR02246 family)